MATGVELATAWIRLVPSADGIQGELSKSLDGPAEAAGEKAGKKSGKKFSTGMKMAVTIGAATIVAGVTKVFQTGMDELKFGETINAQTQQLIDNTGFTMATDQINDYTLALSKVSGISEEDLQQAGNEVLKFGNLSEENYKKAVDSINNMGAAGKDVAGVGTALGKALADPAAAAGLLKRQGVILTDQQKEQIDTMVEAGDVAGAQSVILDSLEGTYGGMAEATGATLTGNINKLQNAWENTAGALVEQLMPAIMGLIDGLMMAVEWMQANPAAMQALAIVVGILAAAFVILTVAMWAASLTPIGLMVAGIIIAIGLLVAAIVWLVMNWDQVWAWIAQTFEGFIGWITGLVEGFVGWWNGLWESVGNFLKQLWNNIVNWVSTALRTVFAVVQSVGNAIRNWWEGLWNGVSNFIAQAWANIISVVNGIQGAFRNAFNTVSDIVRGAFEGVVGIVKGVINNIIRAVNGVIGGINGVAGAIGDAIGVNLKIGTIPMLAKGGTITGAGSVIVGERGPELLNLPTGASVNPDIPDFAAGTGELSVYDVDGVLIGRMQTEARAVTDRHAGDTSTSLSTGRRR